MGEGDQASWDPGQRVKDGLILVFLGYGVGTVHVPQHALTVDHEQRPPASGAPIVHHVIGLSRLQPLVAQVRERQAPELFGKAAVRVYAVSADR